MPRYIEQDSTQTLREGLGEYYAHNPGLLDPAAMSDGAAVLFRQHDAGHVVFGCDTSLRGETLIDTWTLFATTAGLRGYLEYFRQPQVNQIFQEAGWGRIALELVRCLPSVLRVMARSARMERKWPWRAWEAHLDRPLAEVRRDHGISVV